MKRIIVLLISIILCICTVSIYASGQDGLEVVCNIDDEIDGVVNESIDVNANIVILGGSYTFDTDSLSVDDDISDWINNLPQGLSCILKEVTQESLVIGFAGIPKVKSKDLIVINIPNIYILDETKTPISDEGESLVLNECISFNIIDPYITCNPITISKTKDDNVKEELTVSIYEGGQGYFIAEEIVKYIEQFDGLTVSYESLNEMHNVLTLIVKGTVTKDGKYPITIDGQALSYKESMETNTPCIIVEVKEPVTPDKPDNPPYVPTKTGVE